MAALLLGAAAQFLGFSQLGIWVASTIGAIIDAIIFAPKPQTVEGPRIKDTKTIKADPGTPIPIVFGQDRVAGSLIQSSKLIETKHSKKVGGKGGGGNTQITYTYHVDQNWMMCEGPILGVGRIWADGKLLRGPPDALTADNDDSEDTTVTPAALPFPTRYNNPDAIYDPALCPWSLDRTLTPTNDGKFYTRTTVADASVFTEVSSGSVGGLQGAGTIVYWKDNASGYYFPLPETHASGAGDGSHRRAWTDYHNRFDALNDYSRNGVLKSRAINSIRIYRGKSDQMPDSFMQTMAGETIPANRNKATIVFEHFQLDDYGNRIPNMSFEVFQADRTDIQTIASNLITRAQVPVIRFNVDDIGGAEFQTLIYGYTIARDTNYRAAFETLNDFANVDVAEIGPVLYFRPIERGIDHIIDYNDLGCMVVSDGAEPRPILEMTRRRVSSMPVGLFLTFRDVNRDYQDNTADFTRQISTATQKSTLEASAVMSFSRAKQYVRDKMRRLWLERISYQDNALPHKYLYMSPTDYVRIIGPTQDITVKITKMTRGNNGLIEFDAIQRTRVSFPFDDTINTDDPYVGNPGPKDDMGTVMELMDIPILVDDNDQFGFYVALSGASDDWRGAIVYKSVDAEVSYDPILSTSIAEDMGTVTTGTLVSNANPAILDRVSSIVVTLASVDSGLATITPVELANLNNYCVIGDEVCQYLTAEFLGSNQYRLTNFLRGRLGTEEALGTHVANERFVKLDAGVTMPSYETIYNRDKVNYYKPVTNGLNVSDVTGVAFVNTGRKLKPYSPVLITATRDGSGATIKWVRRNRLFNYMQNGVGVPNSEDFEKYDIEVWNDTRTTLIRSFLGVTDVTEVLYTTADQTTDFGSPPTAFEVTVYQLGSVIGRGMPGTARV